LISVSNETFEHLAEFKGYGNPAGKYWFIGSEEGLEDASDLNSEIERRGTLDEIEDLARARKKGGSGAWYNMALIALKIDGSEMWKQPTPYKEKFLGRTNGDTFIADLLPLPKTRRIDWPYVRPYADRASYERALLPRRIALLHDVWSRNAPEFVFCYGRGRDGKDWSAFEEMFPGSYSEYWFHEDEPRKRHDIRVGRVASSTIVMTHHLSRLNYEPVGQLIDKVLEHIKANP
jgi:hypothetical protein